MAMAKEQSQLTTLVVYYCCLMCEHSEARSNNNFKQSVMKSKGPVI